MEMNKVVDQVVDVAEDVTRLGLFVVGMETVPELVAMVTAEPSTSDDDD